MLNSLPDLERGEGDRLRKFEGTLRVVSITGTSDVVSSSARTSSKSSKLEGFLVGLLFPLELCCFCCCPYEAKCPSRFGILEFHFPFPDKPGCPVQIKYFQSQAHILKMTAPDSTRNKYSKVSSGNGKNCAEGNVRISHIFNVKNWSF